MKVALVNTLTQIVACVSYLENLDEARGDYTAIEIPNNDTTDYLYRKYENGIFSEEKFPPILPPPEPNDLDLIKQENEQLKEQMTHLNADFQGFMDFYFSNL